MNTKNSSTPFLVPIDQETFWTQIRNIVREEIADKKSQVDGNSNLFQTPGMVYKPLYKMSEVCSFFQITRPTAYEWIKEGKLKPRKIRSRVYFLYQDINILLTGRLPG